MNKRKVHMAERVLIVDDEKEIAKARKRILLVIV